MRENLKHIGNYIKVENGEVSTIYAHCKTLYVKQGEKIVSGQEIAEVGMTGNATGPHLHFEICRGGRQIDPTYIFDFTT